jgi:hypothetical protein
MCRNSWLTRCWLVGPCWVITALCEYSQQGSYR